jgi:hypothetical protein
LRCPLFLRAAAVAVISIAIRFHAYRGWTFKRQSSLR